MPFCFDGTGTSLAGDSALSEDGPVRIVRLNRPQALNAIDEALHTALTDIWQQLDSDREARAVVITGEGRAFTAGGDMGLLQLMLRILRRLIGS